MNRTLFRLSVSDTSSSIPSPPLGPCSNRAGVILCYLSICRGELVAVGSDPQVENLFFMSVVHRSSHVEWRGNSRSVMRSVKTHLCPTEY